MLLRILIALIRRRKIKYCNSATAVNSEISTMILDLIETVKADVQGLQMLQCVNSSKVLMPV